MVSAYGLKRIWSILLIVLHKPLAPNGTEIDGDQGNNCHWTELFKPFHIKGSSKDSQEKNTYTILFSTNGL